MLHLKEKNMIYENLKKKKYINIIMLPLEMAKYTDEV